MLTFDQQKEWLAYPTGKIAKSEYCDACGRFNGRHMACNALVLDGQKLLLVKRGQEPDKGFWDTPGGYLDWDETLMEGAARELREETGLIVSTNDLEFFNIFSNPNNKAKNQVVDVYFLTKKFVGEVKIDNDEVVDYKWFDIFNLPKEQIAFNHMETLNKLIDEFTDY